TIGAAKAARQWGIHYLRAPDNRRQRQSTCQRLCQQQQIRFDSRVLDGKHAACASKTSLYFVGDQQNAMACAKGLQRGEELRRWHDKAALALYWFHDHRRHLLWRHLRQKRSLQRPLPVAATPSRRGSMLTLVAVGERECMDIAGERSKVLAIRAQLAF